MEKQIFTKRERMRSIYKETDEYTDTMIEDIQKGVKE
jgi:hypothetical protein